MKSKKYMLVVLSILMILFVFVSSAGAADANATDVLSVDESSNTINEKLALDYSSDNTVANDTNAVENDEILQNPNSDDDTDTWYVNASATGGDGKVSSPDKENLTISASAEPIFVGDNATVVVTGFPLTSYGAPGGIVTVTVGDKIFSGTIESDMPGGNIARIIVPGLNESTVAAVNYLGDDKYNPANTTVIILVNSKDKKNLTISASAEPIFVGDNATVVVTGFPVTSYGAPSGIVTVTVGDKLLSLIWKEEILLGLLFLV